MILSTKNSIEDCGYLERAYLLTVGDVTSVLELLFTQLWVITFHYSQIASSYSLHIHVLWNTDKVNIEKEILFWKYELLVMQ